MKKLLKIILWIFGLIILLIAVISISNIIKNPSHDREWSEDSKILPDISINENIVEIKNIRDWRYNSEKVISKKYYDESFDLDKIEKSYLLINPFGKWDGIGHSFFIFTFKDGKEIAVSVEARREEDESFNSIKGLFNTYELWYAFGSSADFVTRRAVHYEDSELNMYPLNVSKESTKALLLDLVRTAEKLETEAQFYNTLTSNCTNLLMDSANKVKEGSVPFHYSRLFTGYADDYMYKLGFIPNDQSFEEVNKKYRIDLEVQEINSNLIEYTKEEFWNKLSKKIQSKSDTKIIRWDDWDRSTKVNPPMDYGRPFNNGVNLMFSSGGGVPEGIKFDSFGVEMPSDQFNEYIRDDWGIKFEYPSNYILIETQLREHVYTMFPVNTPGRGGLSSFSILETEMTYKEFRESVNRPEEYSNIVEEREFVIDNKKGNMLVHTTAIGLESYLVFIEHNGNNLIINYPNHPVQREIFNSIKFI